MMYKAHPVPFAALALAVALAAATPAAAQFSNVPPLPVPGAAEPPLSGRQVLQILSRRGFEPLSGARFNGDAYVVDAVSPRGETVRLLVDAFDGQVLRRVNLEGGSLDTRGYEAPPPWVRRYERPGVVEEEEIVRPAPRQPRPAPTVRVEPPPAAAPRAVTPAPAERPVAAAPTPAPERPRARAVPPAPAPAVKAPEPQPERPAAVATPQAPRTGPVRVIEGVTPVLPRSQRGVDEIGVPAPEAPPEPKVE
ncbi:hypothetical protein [Salinarimonas soli]|uniref:PepSY domain-containing protein n=1 Tax=Salinarimonas soli TaxID=1638099 RepID=A0A5B2VEF7_9HYPH|nr:hypothetical protein [Salinarimonas soli]KAA2236557.1 hypothetical protein F0L46_13855 [Salinarimonas soli]